MSWIARPGEVRVLCLGFRGRGKPGLRCWAGLQCRIFPPVLVLVASHGEGEARQGPIPQGGPVPGCHLAAAGRKCAGDDVPRHHARVDGQRQRRREHLHDSRLTCRGLNSEWADGTPVCPSIGPWLDVARCLDQSCSGCWHGPDGRRDGPDLRRPGAATAWIVTNALYLMVGVPLTFRRLMPGETWRWLTVDVGLPLLALGRRRIRLHPDTRAGRRTSPGGSADWDRAPPIRMWSRAGSAHGTTMGCCQAYLRRGLCTCPA